eukprot:7103169-Prymnesium_polylepis.1
MDGCWKQMKGTMQMRRKRKRRGRRSRRQGSSWRHLASGASGAKRPRWKGSLVLVAGPLVARRFAVDPVRAHVHRSRSGASCARFADERLTFLECGFEVCVLRSAP